MYTIGWTSKSFITGWEAIVEAVYPMLTGSSVVLHTSLVNMSHTLLIMSTDSYWDKQATKLKI